MTEKIALAAAMVHNELVAELHPDFFVEHKAVAKSIKRLYYENKSITPNMVALKVEGPIDDIIVYYPTKEEGLEAIKDLKLAFEKRAFTEAIVELGKMNERHSIEASMKIFSDRINSIRDISDRKIHSAEDLIEPLLAQMSEARIKGPWKPLLGIPHVDELIKGYAPGDVTVFLSAPKEGKSSLATRIIQNAIETNSGVFISSGEMPEIDVLIRPLAVMSGHKSSELEDGSVISDNNFLQALDQLKDKKVFISNRGLSIPFMQEEITTYKALHGVDLFMYDQLNLFDEVVNDKGWNGYQQVIASARRIANQLRVAVIIFHQVNKDQLVKPSFRPSVYSARGGQASLMQSTKVILIHRPEAHGLANFEDGPFKGVRSAGLIEIFVGLGNRIRFGSALAKFIGEQQAILPPDESINMGGKSIMLREAYYHGSAPELVDDAYIGFGSEKSSVQDELPF